jgi:hypothetical protein
MCKFKVDDPVYTKQFGFGNVVSVDDNENRPIRVFFKDFNRMVLFTSDGRRDYNSPVVLFDPRIPKEQSKQE